MIAAAVIITVITKMTSRLQRVCCKGGAVHDDEKGRMDENPYKAFDCNEDCV